MPAHLPKKVSEDRDKMQAALVGLGDFSSRWYKRIRIHSGIQGLGPDVNKMAVFDLTHQTEGNANGVGTADFTTQRLVDKMDLEKRMPTA